MACCKWLVMTAVFVAFMLLLNYVGSEYAKDHHPGPMSRSVSTGSITVTGSGIVANTGPRSNVNGNTSTSGDKHDLSHAR